MAAQSTALNIAQSYLDAVLAAGVPVKKAFLFGSQSRNEQNEWSDIDVALVADDFVGLAAVDKDRFRWLHIQPEFLAIEAHTFSTSRFEGADFFVFEIKRTGIELKIAP